MRILYVCTGNACRSPLAQTITEELLKEAGVEHVEVDSVGTQDWGENPRDATMVAIAAEHGYTMSGTTRYMTAAALDAADIIVVMSPYHRDKVTSMLRYDRWDRIVTFCQYAFGSDSGITDPSGGTEALYRKVFDEIERGCAAIVEKAVFSTQS